MAPTVFISYSKADSDAALALALALRDAELDPFVDVEKIRSGDRWLGKLEEHLATCNAFVVLVGSQGVQRWVGAEVAAALSRNLMPQGDGLRLPIHPVLLGDTPPEALPPFLALFQATRWNGQADPPPGLIQALKDGAERLDERPRFDGCPFLGLATFQQQHAELFFGRRAETLAALAGLGDQQQRGLGELGRGPAKGYVRWLQINGASGSGKSSLVRAGLLPLVERGALWPRTGLARWQVIGPLMPGRRPLERLAEAVELALQPDPYRRDIAALCERFMADPRALTLHLRGLKLADTGWLLVIDQFEELFTLAEDAERAAFDAALAEALADADAPLFVVSTVRSDFLDRIELLPRLAALYNARCKPHLLEPIAREGLREVIELPARLAGLDVSEVTTAMLQDAEGEPGALPLVENALHRLWHQRSGARLSGDQYRQQGGLAGMLSQAADKLVARVDADVQQAFGRGHDRAALELLLALVQYDPAGRHTRRRITREEAVHAAGNGENKVGERVLGWLSGQRDGERPVDATGEALRLVVVLEEGGTSTVDLIHETLVRSIRQHDGSYKPYWPTLVQYVALNRDRDLLRQQLLMKAERWARSRRWTRWFRLAGWSELLDFRRLRPAPRGDSVAARFLASSRRSVGVQAAGVVACLLAWGAWVWQDELLDFSAVGYNAVYYTVAMAWWSTGGATVTMPELEQTPASHEDQGVARCAMGRYAVTNLQYNRFIWEESGRQWSALWRFPARGIFGTPDRPVVNVSWHDTQTFLSWLNGRATDKALGTYRLPRSAEWEQAARGSKGSPYPWGDAPPQGRANCGDCGGWHAGKRTAPVGSFEPNDRGLYDLVGNVWQWMDDRWDESSPARVLRGGSWRDVAAGLRVASRGEAPPHNRYNFIGFRVCRSSPIERPTSAPQDAEPLGR